MEAAASAQLVQPGHQPVQPDQERKLGLFAERNYLILLAAKAISRFGDSLDSIAYSWMVYLLTGSKLLMGTLFAVSIMPNIVLSLFSGVLVDRWSIKRIVVITGAGRGMIVFVTGLMFYLGFLAPWHLFVFAVINSSFEAFSTPAELSLVRKVLPRELLLKGNSFTSAISRTAEIIGLGAAGTIIAWLGISSALWIDAGTFFTSALLLSFLSLRQAAADDAAPPTATPAAPVADALTAAASCADVPSPADALSTDAPAIDALPTDAPTIDTLPAAALPVDVPPADTPPAAAPAADDLPTAAAPPKTDTSHPVRTYVRELKEGFLCIRQNTLLLTTALLATFVNFCIAPLEVLLTVYVKDSLNSGASGLSVLWIAMTAGMILGGLAMSKWGSLPRKSTLILGGILLLGGGYALLGVPPLMPGLPGLMIAAVLMFLIGSAVTMASVPISSYMMEATPEGMLGRVGSLTNMLCMGAMPLGAAAAGAVAEGLSTAMIYAVMGFLILLPTLLLFRYKSFRRI